MLGWIGTALLIYSWWRLGYKEPSAILIGIAGSVFWAVEGYLHGLWALVTVEVVLGFVQFNSWLKWKRYTCKSE